MKETNVQACPACGAALRFDPESGKMVCDWCGSTYDPGAVAEDTGEKQKDKKKKSDSQTGEAMAFESTDDGLCIYHCSSCHAELICQPQSIASACPYCGQNLIRQDQVLGELRPDGIIPFAFSKEELPKIAAKFYKNKKLLPRNFFSERRVGEPRGIYVPYWIYNCTFDSTVVLNGDKSSSHRSGDYIVTETRRYRLSRGVSMSFEGIPADASKSMDDTLMESVEPFELKDLKPFSTDYLAGFAADRYDQDEEAVRKRCEERAISSAANLILQRTAGGYSNVSLTKRPRPATMQARYVLFPVYLFDVVYKDRTYSFAANGQTGRMVGDLPISKGKKHLAFWGTLAAVLAIMGLIMLLTIL